MKKIPAILVLSLIAYGLPAQEESLEAYVNEGLRNNLALKQKEANYRKSLQVLKQARAMFYPEVSLNARYTVAEGGRIIEFPVGDMLNPVYQTLNSLTGSQMFTDIENVEFSFYRPREHETGLQVIQPVIDPRIRYNRKINEELSNAMRADADAYRRQLVAEIKTAYFGYLKTVELLELLDETRLLLTENIRVNESLYKNDKVTIDNVYRSRAELSRLDQQYAEARKSRNVAKAWFNFLLNRPMETGIMAGAGSDSIPLPDGIETLTARAMEKREELRMLESYSSVADNYLGLNRSGLLPSLYASVDYGFQGSRYEFNGNQDYMLASLVLRWNIFHGFDNRAKIGEAKIEKALRSTQMEEAGNRIRLQVIDAYYDLAASGQSIKAAREELSSARKAFRVMERKYGGGQASLIEFIDARTAMTRAGQRLIISKYDYFIKYAGLEKVACLYTFQPEEN